MSVNCQWKSAQSKVHFIGGFKLNPANYISGAIVNVVPHPTNADVTFAVSTNGGIWRTDNAQSSDDQLTWKPLTDSQKGHSFGVLTFDKSDTQYNTLYAGPARLSSYASVGGDLLGLYQSSDLGNTWQILGQYRDKHFQDLFVDGNLIIGCHRTVQFTSHNDPGETQQQAPAGRRRRNNVKRVEDQESAGQTHGGYSVSTTKGQQVEFSPQGTPPCHSLHMTAQERSSSCHKTTEYNTPIYLIG